MDAIREYLGSIPYFPDQIMMKIGLMLESNELDYNNAEQMQAAIVKAQGGAITEIREKQVAYYVITYPQVLFRCRECGPNHEKRGAYWEISNPISCVRGMFPMRMMHEIIEHGNVVYEDPIVNQSETVVDVFQFEFYWKRLQKILNGLPLPAAAQRELADLAIRSAR